MTGTQVAAAKSLGQIGDQRAVQPLISHLENTNETVRQAISNSLADLGPLSVEPLIKVAGDPNSLVRQTAIGVLGKVGDKRAVTPLIAVLSERGLRESAANALAELGEPLGKTFVKALHGDRPSLEQMTAGKDPRFVEQLLNTLGDQEPSVQKDAALALGQMCDGRAVPWLIQALRKGGSVFSHPSRRGTGQNPRAGGGTTD